MKGEGEIDVGTTLDHLMRALGAGSTERAGIAYRELYRIGPGALPKIERSLLSNDWSDISFPHQVTVFTVLLSIIHDIDEDFARRLSDRIRDKDCDPRIVQRTKSIVSHSVVDFRAAKIGGCDVLISKELASYQTIKRCLERWIDFVPEGHLDEIQRITVVPRRDHHAYSGLYHSMLFAIRLIWGSESEGRGLLAWFEQFVHESTFYHEVGHHYYRHKGGQDPVQEREADRYAAQRLKESHPVMVRLIAPISRVSRRLGFC